MKVAAARLVMTVGLLLIAGPLFAMVSGICSDCHTMHNSQDGSPLNYDDDPAPNPSLTRGTCTGCHAQQGSTRTVSLSGSEIPQVMHTDTIDLAGGNFYYVFGSDGSDSKGHNVIDLGAPDGILSGPPGSPHGAPYSTKLTCAGINGCHGNTPLLDPEESMAGAHHSDDTTITGTSLGNSYRFLRGVIGLEAPDWENADSDNHNEYHGHAGMDAYSSCAGCHFSGGIAPAGSSITHLCVRCHRDMHTIDSGGDNVWIRHPSDTVIPASGEYQYYTAYDVEAPVGRVTVPATASNEVIPGTDVVTCLSCHVSHGSDYPDLLRWDYSQIIAAGGNNGNGCFICHSTKDE